MSPWLLAIRPATLAAAIAPVLVGTAAARAPLRFGPFLGALAASLLIQIGANLANDLSDFYRGADMARQGPVRVTQGGLLRPAQVRRAVVASFGLAGVIGLYLAAVGGWPIVVAGVLAIVAAVTYTGGPWPYGYHGLGDLSVFVFFGVVAVVGSAYLQVLAVTAVALWASVPVALLVSAILVVNNLRDVETDRAAGKRTLAVVIGERATRLEYTLFVGGAYVAPLGLYLAGQAGRWFWLPYLTLPLAVPLVRLVLAGRGAALNRALAQTGRLHLAFGILFAASLAL